MGFKHYPQISKEDIPSMNIENVNAFLRDFQYLMIKKNQ